MKSNIPINIREKIGKNLYQVPRNPICITKKRIYDIIGVNREIFEGLSPLVSVKSNFDELLIPEDHPTRSKSDTFYENENTVLRTHTSAHQSELIRNGHKNFLVTGDVYRRDEIDAYHYPVFHQMEGVTIYDYVLSDAEIIEIMKLEMTYIVKSLFPEKKFRIVDSYFPFTEISGEVEIFSNNKWVEVIGFGSIHNKILQNCGLESNSGWAFGLGIERIAMILFGIPDIRYFWSIDYRFTNQFSEDEITEFKQYSTFPSSKRDISFYHPENFQKNDFFNALNTIAENLVAKTEILDEFYDEKKGKSSMSFRIHFESLERTLTAEEVNRFVDKIKSHLVENFSVEIR